MTDYKYPLELTPEAQLVQRIFVGRLINENMENKEAEKQPTEKMFRCTNALPGCGQAKPANGFYKEIKELCSECSLKLARKHDAGLESVSMIFSCYEITRQFSREVKTLIGGESEQYVAGFKKLIKDGGIDRGRNHFVKQMIVGARDQPTDLEYFQSLSERYKKWFFTEFGIDPSLYSNLPKNDLLS